MNNPGIQEEIWAVLSQKWSKLAAEGHNIKVEFNLLRDPQDKILAIDVAQNIDGEWHIQTVQKQPRQAYAAMGIEGFDINQLINIASRVVNSVTESITGRETYDDEMHLFMKRGAPETSEISGYIISKTGEKVGVRTNYRHYYVMNEILEQISNIMREEYAEIQLHRDKDNSDRIYFRFVRVQ